MSSDLVRATTLAVLTDHYYASGSWHPNGNRNGTGWWLCRCGAKGEPIDRNLTKGHRAHVAEVMVRALVPESVTR